mgnify:CR=1 FL=1
MAVTLFVVETQFEMEIFSSKIASWKPEGSKLFGRDFEKLIRGRKAVFLKNGVAIRIKKPSTQAGFMVLEQ